MTIIAGFCAKDGILLGADSLFTGGSKVNQQKIFGYHIGLGTPEMCALAFAIAGHEDNAMMAIEDCVEAFGGIAPKERTAKNVKLSLRKVIKEIHSDYVDSRPDYERQDAAFELIIGAWLPMAGGLRLYKTSGPRVRSTEPYHCAGSGAYLGDYLMKKIFTRHWDLKQTSLIAIQGIAAAKSYDAHVGGPMQFMSIREGGQLSNSIPYNTQDAEHYVNHFDSEARKLLFHLGNTAMTDEDFENHVQRFTEIVSKIRSYWRKGVDPRIQEILDLIGFKRAGSPNPQSPTDDPSRPPPSPE